MHIHATSTFLCMCQGGKRRAASKGVCTQPLYIKHTTENIHRIKLTQPSAIELLVPKCVKCGVGQRLREMCDDNAGSTESSRAGQQNPAKVFPLLKNLQTDCLAAVRSPEHGPRVGLRMELCGYEDKLVDGTVVLVCKRCEEVGSSTWVVQLEPDPSLDEEEVDCFEVPGHQLRQVASEPQDVPSLLRRLQCGSAVESYSERHNHFKQLVEVYRLLQAKAKDLNAPALQTIVASLRSMRGYTCPASTAACCRLLAEAADTAGVNLGQAGAIDVIAGALMQHNDSVDVQVMGLYAIYQLARKPENKKAAGAVQCSAQTLACYMTCIIQRCVITPRDIMIVSLPQVPCICCSRCRERWKLMPTNPSSNDGPVRLSRRCRPSP